MPHCAYCNQPFDALTDLRYHIREVHPGANVHVCPDCGKHFTRSAGLTEHMRVHTGERPFSCSGCGASFTRRCHLRQHMKTHSEDKKHICTLCGAEYANSRSLTTHMQKKHPFEDTINRDLNKKMNDPDNAFDSPETAHRFLRNFFATGYQICPHCRVCCVNPEHHAMTCPFWQGPSRV